MWLRGPFGSRGGTRSQTEVVVVSIGSLWWLKVVAKEEKEEAGEVRIDVVCRVLWVVIFKWLCRAQDELTTATQCSSYTLNWDAPMTSKGEIDRWLFSLFGRFSSNSLFTTSISRSGNSSPSSSSTAIASWSNGFSTYKKWFDVFRISKQ